MKTCILSLALLVASVMSARAQKGDYVIPTKGDTIWCHISNPLIGAMNYKVEGSEPVKISPEHISEYYRAGKKWLCRAVYQERKTKPVFMTVAENGPISLYEVVHTSYNGTSVSSVKNWFVGKKSNHVSLLKTSGLVLTGKSHKERKDDLAEMLKDKKEVYDAYIAEDKFSFKQIKNLVHWYNTGKKI